MTEKKNYCVDGKCTANAESDQNCCEFGWVTLSYHRCMYGSPRLNCACKKANAEWRKTNGTDN